MRVKTFPRVLRIISCFVLSFFSWTYGPIYAAVAYAATNQKTEDRSQRSGQTTEKSNAERFENALENIRENIGKAGEKARRNEDVASELEAIKSKKAEIESLDGELRKQLASTEKKIAGLPREIRDRHTAFVKCYTDNYNQLRTELADINAAKTMADRATKIEKARLYLEKVKAQRKHTSLDPNQLPHRSVRAKEKAPRLKKEEFERDFPRSKSRNKQKFAEKMFNELFAKDLRRSPSILNSAFNKPVLLALNEVASDVPLSLAGSSVTPQVAFSESEPLLLAQATDAPTADDLAENGIEIQFSDAIKAKGQELGCSAVKIFEFTRNEISFVPTYGSIQGADMCLQTKECNSIDTSSLLISLLRSCSIPARYAYGTVEIPIDKVKNWVGGFSDSTAALSLMASGGIPVAAGTSGGTITKARLEHVWVEANIAYGPYSGRSSKLNPDKIWVPLDPSYKQFTYSEGLDLQAAVPFDAQAFADQVKATASVNETEGYVTNVDSNYIQTTMTGYQTQVQNYIKQNLPNATVGDIFGKKEIKKQELGILPLTLPYKVVTLGSRYSEIPDSLRHKISISLLDENGSDVSISTTKSLPEVSGKKITLSYSPATSSDESLLISYADSNTTNIPAYLVNLKPELRIDGQVVGTGKSVGMGRILPFKLTLSSPALGDTLITNNNIAGTYTAVVLDLGITTSSQLDKIKARVEATKAKLDSGDYSGISKDDIMGEFLHGIGTSYWGMLDAINKISAQMNGVADIRLPSEGTFTYDLQPSYLFGMPVSAVPTGFMTDIDGDQHVVVARDGYASREVNYMAQIGMFASRMEASVYDLTFNQQDTGKGITTAHIFEYANQQGIPVYTVDSNNINTMLPLLTVEDEVKTDIQNAINAGKIVTIPKTTITKDSWTGSGYLVFDKTTGSGAYKISGGLSGGGYTCNCFGFSPIVEFLLGLDLAVMGALGSTALALPLAIVSIGLSAISLYSTICQINQIPNLTDDQRTALIALTVLMFILSAAAAVASVFVFGAPVFIFGIYWIFVSLAVSNITTGIGWYLSNRNNQAALILRKELMYVS